MTKLQIDELLGERAQWWLAATSQIEYSVIRRLASQTSQRLKYSTLDKLCDALKCQPGDLLRRVPESRDSAVRREVRKCFSAGLQGLAQISGQ
jgi:DNA-binding Xre family transcriptional regulator